MRQYAEIEEGSEGGYTLQKNKISFDGKSLKEIYSSYYKTIYGFVLKLTKD